MRVDEEPQTRSLLSIFRWHAVDAEIAEKAGDLGRAWLPSHRETTRLTCDVLGADPSVLSATQPETRISVKVGES